MTALAFLILTGLFVALAAIGYFLRDAGSTADDVDYEGSGVAHADKATTVSNAARLNGPGTGAAF